MFSTLTERGAAHTLEALALGATDYVTKPANVGSLDAATARVRDELIPRIKALHRPRDRRRARPVRRAGRRPAVAVPGSAELGGRRGDRRLDRRSQRARRAAAAAARRLPGAGR